MFELPRALAFTFVLGALLAACSAGGTPGSAGADAQVDGDGADSGDTSTDGNGDGDTESLDAVSDGSGEVPDTVEPPDVAIDDATGDGDTSAADIAGDTATACTPPAATGELQVRTARATWEGERDGDAQVWRGIAYAAAPVGALRWHAPQQAACHTEVQPATEFGPKCAQRVVDGEFEGDEDCLTLNVWTPAVEPPPEGWPTMVFIHGGGNVVGSARQLYFERAANSLIYDGRYLAESRQVAVVTIQYRLGALGFLAHSSLETPDAGLGNWGILDQVAALEWVRENIAAFGADPERVMIFGESGGGVDVCVHLASPRSRGLFTTAAIQSAACVAESRAAAVERAERRVGETSCAETEDIAACLRSLAVDDLLAQLPGAVQIARTQLGTDDSSFGPVVDGVVLEDAPQAVISAGDQARVPLIIGSNGEEVAEAVPDIIDNQAELEAAIRSLMAPLLVLDATIDDTLIAAYPVSDYASPQQAYEAVLADMRFNCTARRVAVEMAAAQPGVPVYRYFFTRNPETTSGPRPAVHGLELSFVFGSYRNIPLYTAAETDADLSALMMGYWAALASYSNPNATDDTSWQSITGEDPTMVFDATSQLSDGVRDTQCDVWDSILDSL